MHRDGAAAVLLDGSGQESLVKVLFEGSDVASLGDNESQKPLSPEKTRGPPGLLNKLWGGSEYSGLACSALAALLAAFMGLLVKLLSHQSIPSFQMVLIRSLVVATMAGVGLSRRGIAVENWVGSKNMRGVVMGRAICGFIGISAFVYSVQVLDLKDAVVLNFTLPIFVAIFCAIFIGEPWGLQEAASTAVSFMGVVLIARPEVVWGNEVATTTDDAPMIALKTFGVAIALGGALAGGGAYTLLRVVGKGGEHPLVPVFAFALVSIPLSTIFMGATQTPVMPTLATMSGCVLFGLMSFAQQALLSRGMQLEKGSRASAMQYIKVLGSFILGVAFLNEVPTVPSAVGAILICASSAVVAKQAGQA